jgi:hypothetical protein
VSNVSSLAEQTLLFIRRQIAGGLSRSFANPNGDRGGSKAGPVDLFTVHSGILNAINDLWEVQF